ESQPLSTNLTTQVQLPFAGEVAFVRLLSAPDRSSINGFSFNPCGSIEAVELQFDYIHKPTFSKRYLNYLSYLISQKRGVIIGMLDKAVLLLSPKFHYKNIKFIVDALLNNDHRIDFISHINSRLKFLFHKLFMKERNDTIDTIITISIHHVDI
ncbi:hypothetical protein ALC56_07470, partial [Trachymyrmex septentrionalis]